MSKKVLIFALLAFCCMCSFVCLGIFVFVQLSSNIVGQAPISKLPQPTTTYAPNDPVGYTPIVLDNSGTPVNLIVEDIYNANLVFKQDSSSFIPEIDWMSYVVKTASSNGWNGSPDTKLPIDANSIPQNMIDKLENERILYDQRREIPSNYEKFYIGPQVKSEMLELMATMRKEYIAYLKAKGINSKYITEIETNALPSGAANLFYDGINDIDGMSQVQTLIDANGNKNDYSKLQLEISANGIYNDSRKIFSSGILGTQPEEGTAEFDAYYLKVRSIGLRYVMYHEMGHVLQRVVDNTNVPESEKTSKGNWYGTKKSLYYLDTKYYIKWTPLETTSEVFNHELSQESQAEGIAFEVLTSVYNMSDVQKRLTWENLFGRLNGFRDKFDEVTNIFMNQYPDFDITDIEQKIYDDIIAPLDSMGDKAHTLYQTNKKLGSLPAYAGYLHPREPQDMPALWEFLK